MGTKRTTKKQQAIEVKNLPARPGEDVKGGVRPGGGCDEFGCGTNHNETLLRD